MPTFRDPEQLRKAQLARFARVKRSLKIEHDKAVREEIGNKAQKLLSGTISQATIRKTRPGLWSRRRGGTGAPRLPINEHTGRLKRSMRLFPIKDGWRLIFAAPYAKFILAPGGTKNMVARGFWSEMNKASKRITARVAARLRREENS